MSGYYCRDCNAIKPLFASPEPSGLGIPCLGTVPFDPVAIPGMEGAPEARPGQAGEPIPVRWTAAAEARLANIPAFVRPMARTGIERFARENGSLEVNEQILDARAGVLWHVGARTERGSWGPASERVGGPRGKSPRM